MCRNRPHRRRLFEYMCAWENCSISIHTNTRTHVIYTYMYQESREREREVDTDIVTYSVSTCMDRYVQMSQHKVISINTFVIQ